MHSVRARGTVALVALVVVLTGCSSSERPDPATWLQRWQAITALVPEQSQLADPPEESICQATLAAIREQSEELFPTPSVTVDDLANEWVSVAETTFFECPPEGQDLDSMDDAYRELARVEDSVETALSE